MRPVPHLLLAASPAVVAGVAVLSLAPGASHVPNGGRAVPVLAVVIGWSFVALAALAWSRRPGHPVGRLLWAFGTAVTVSALSIADAPVPYVLSTVGDALAIAVFAHLLLAFPSGSLPDRASRVLAGAFYAVVLGAQALKLLFDAHLGDPACRGCPRNPLLVADLPDASAVVQDVQRAGTLVLVLALVALLARRHRRATAAERRALAPVLASGALILGLGALSAAAQDAVASPGVRQAAQVVFVAAFATLPAAFLAGLVRTRFFRTATVARLLERLTAERGTDGLGGALAAALGDPSAAVAHWLPEQDAYVAPDGRPFALPPDGDGRVATEVTHQGRRVGVLLHDAALGADPQLVEAATGAAALALVNERLEVELRAQVEALRDSRARIVQAGDAERRRLGRDLHDGAQQHLVSVLIDLQLARERWEGQPERARELVESALATTQDAVADLRDLAAGIHPAVLSQRGLGAAVETLAARSPVPVELELRLDRRLPAPVETAAYFVVAEALTNVAKYAGATYARVAVRRQGATAVVEVVDDGAGGADPRAGSGLRGLADRVGALDGTLEIRSPPGLGTVVRARFPGAA